eukprot:gnl/Chilomastix_caulleri/4477.p2 GENE.gnl/Chilomastix_caulleri/4477~~gnl/Chilomastix_caulleri/4477.p2  ORF type:complete len:60 (-),score=16.00 gnl/Chilomastix_caulleri/4477:70-249(-)
MVGEYKGKRGLRWERDATSCPCLHPNNLSLHLHTTHQPPSTIPSLTIHINVSLNPNLSH